MKLVEKTFGFFAPDDCILCGGEGGLVCGWCYPEAFEPVPSRCFSCKAQTDSSAVCAKCRRGCSLKHVWVATEYKHNAEKLVRLLKFSNKRSAAQIIGRVISDNLPYLQKDLIVCHIPTATSRIRQRGYDQSRLVSQELAKILGLEHVTLLRRQGQSRQVGTSRQKRINQLKGAYTVVHEGSLKNRNILLIDDVTTTGATLIEAAQVLRLAGARQINAAVFAQKV